MKSRLDTHAVVWLYTGETERFTKKGKAMIESEQLVISPMVQLERDSAAVGETEALAAHPASSALRRGGPLTGLVAEIPELSGLAVRRVFAEFGVGRTAGVALLLVDSLGRLLVVRSRHRRTWSPPGGFLHPYEPPAPAILRELEEETGLRIDAPPLLFTTIAGPGRRHDTHVFVAALDAPGPHASSDRAWEIVDVRWMTPSDDLTIHPSLAGLIDGSDPASAVAIDDGTNRFVVRDRYLDRPRRMAL